MTGELVNLAKGWVSETFVYGILFLRWGLRLWLAEVCCEEFLSLLNGALCIIRGDITFLFKVTYF